MRIQFDLRMLPGGDPSGLPEAEPSPADGWSSPTRSPEPSWRLPVARRGCTDQYRSGRWGTSTNKRWTEVRRPRSSRTCAPPDDAVRSVPARVQASGSASSCASSGPISTTARTDTTPRTSGSAWFCWWAVEDLTLQPT